MTALTAVAHADDLLALLRLEVRREARDRDITDAAGYIDIAVAIRTIVEEEARIVVEAIELLHLPRSLGICGGEHEVTTVIAKGNEVEKEFSVVVFQARCPLALTVMVLAVEQVVGIGIVDLQ